MKKQIKLKTVPESQLWLRRVSHKLWVDSGGPVEDVRGSGNDSRSKKYPAMAAYSKDMMASILQSKQDPMTTVMTMMTSIKTRPDDSCNPPATLGLAVVTLSSSLGS
jgi:hypothetical protein